MINLSKKVLAIWAIFYIIKGKWQSATIDLKRWRECSWCVIIKEVPRSIFLWFKKQNQIYQKFESNIKIKQHESKTRIKQTFFKNVLAIKICKVL